ncbi:MAG: gfo/Idh/MocA family oxidoreductase, partial [Sphingobacteriales bacterium]
PEGYLEAFANIYKNFALTVNAKLNNEEPTAEMLDFPTTEDGVRGMAFIENVVASSQSDLKWHDYKI